MGNLSKLIPPYLLSKAFKERDMNYNDKDDLAWIAERTRSEKPKTDINTKVNKWVAKDLIPSGLEEVISKATDEGWEEFKIIRNIEYSSDGNPRGYTYSVYAFMGRQDMVEKARKEYPQLNIS